MDVVRSQENLVRSDSVQLPSVRFAGPLLEGTHLWRLNILSLIL